MIVYQKQKVAKKWELIYSNWKSIQLNFENNWDSIKNNPRVEIHVPSLS